MTTTEIRHRFGIGLGAGLLLAVLLLPEAAAAQCVGATTVENFATNMKGCAGTFDFTTRASRCAAGWHVCSATEWVNRYGGKIPTYNYWTNDNLRYDNSNDGCFVSLSSGIDCSPTPMRVCTALRGDRDGVYATASRFYVIQTFLADGSVTLVTAIDRVTLGAQSFAGAFSGDVFVGALLGGAGALTLTFTSDNAGTDGTSTFTKVADEQIPPTDFRSVSDPLGNVCNWHACGLDTALPNRYFGGCSGNTTAGVLCCQ